MTVEDAAAALAALTLLPGCTAAFIADDQIGWAQEHIDRAAAGAG